VQHFLRRLTEITVIALAGVVLGSAQTSQPAQSGQAAAAAPAEKKKQYKDQQEYTLYDSVTKETDANKKLATLNTWKDKYPESDFKQERLALFLSTYQTLGQGAKMVDTAKEILGNDPKDITALYWITFLSPSVGNNSADAVATATKAANGLLAAEKPAATKDEDWKSAKTNFDAIAYKTLGWAAAVPKNYAEAEQNYKKSLQIDPKSGEVAYSLGQALLARSIAEKKPAVQSEALYYFARAASYDGPGALNPAGRKTVDDYLTKVYNTLHGDSSGLAELKALAKANPVPPADFKIKTAAEVAAEQDEELKKTNPSLALWKQLKGQLLSPDGETYFGSSMKDAAVPKLKGWLVAAKPPVKSKELLVAMDGKDQAANVTLRLVGGADGTTATPLTGKPELGTEIEFEGTGKTFTKEPFMVTFDIEKAKITGLKEEKVAAPVHHTAKKKS
jgi:tetratricopeptide (TPR) repeat protein